MFEKESEDLSSINLDNYQDSTVEDKRKCSIIVIFVSTAFLFVIMAVISLVANYNHNTLSIPLTASNRSLEHPATTYLSFGSSTTVNIYLQFDQLTQFQQTSVRGDPLATAETCQHFSLNKEVAKTVALDGSTLSPSAKAIPCGFYAAMFPVDSIKISWANGTDIPIETADLTTFRMQPQTLQPSLQWADLNNPILESWLQPNAQPRLTKLIGRLTTTSDGLVSVTISRRNDLPGSLGPVSLRMVSSGSFGEGSIGFCVISFVQCAILFLFGLVIYYHNRMLAAERKDPKEHTLKLKIEGEHLSAKKV